MNSKNTNKLKIFNDPIYGFVSIPTPLVYDVIEHPYFQRLRRISQTGLTYYVYPGAMHTRFHHALGAMHLMYKALQEIKKKGTEISFEEEEAAQLAILLHDIGHGPFSHALESTILEGVHHEKVTLHLFQELNSQFQGKLTKALDMFQGVYPRPFFHQLITSQLDVDRLDYLKRDSFYTGVAEGNINTERLIQMLHVVDNQLVVEYKGIYSVEKYLTSRLFMYWQVYYHKTSLAAEVYMIKALERAKKLGLHQKEMCYSPALNYFIHRTQHDALSENELTLFAQLDDADVTQAIKQWQHHDDVILSFICKSIIERKLPFSIVMLHPMEDEEIHQIKKRIVQQFGEDAVPFLFHHQKITITPYNTENSPIILLQKDKKLIPLHHSDFRLFPTDLIKESVRYQYCFPISVL